MRFKIKHEIKGRIRVHIIRSRMTFEQADTLQYYLDSQDGIVSAKIQERTCDVSVVYEGTRDAVIDILKHFSFENAIVPEDYVKNSGRELNR